MVCCSYYAIIKKFKNTVDQLSGKASCSAPFSRSVTNVPASDSPWNTRPIFPTALSADGRETRGTGNSRGCGFRPAQCAARRAYCAQRDRRILRCGQPALAEPARRRKSLCNLEGMSRSCVCLCPSHISDNDPVRSAPPPGLSGLSHILAPLLAREVKYLNSSVEIYEYKL